jgi:hypothetical protein
VLKPILTSAAFAGVLMASAAAMTQERGAPDGSYRASCRSAHIYGDHLTADCRRADGRWEQTSLFDLNRCSGDIANVNGRLVCGHEGYGSSRTQRPYEPWRGEGYYRGDYGYGR